jgi:hypothetical protein
LHALLALGGAEAVKSRKVIQHFRRRQIVIEIRLFRQIANVPVHRHIIHGLVQDSRASRRRENDAHQQFDRRAFPGTIWSQKSEHFAVFDLHRQAFQRSLLLQMEKSVWVLFG